MIKLSIITICFNEKDKIEKTLISVINQKFTNYEFIVIDGGSTDGTKEIIEKYRDDITIFVSEKDSGIYNAMNKGINKSSGEYLLFLNGGDYLYSDDTLDELFEKYNPTDDIVYGNIITTNNGSLVKVINPFPSKKFFFFITSLPHQSSFIKRELFINDGLYDENFRIVSDQEFFMRELIKNKKKMVYVPITISYYDNQSYSMSADIKLLEIQNREKTIMFKKYFNKFELFFYPPIAKIFLLIKNFIKRILRKMNKLIKQ